MIRYNYKKLFLYIFTFNLLFFSPVYSQNIADDKLAPTSVFIRNSYTENTKIRGFSNKPLVTKHSIEKFMKITGHKYWGKKNIINALVWGYHNGILAAKQESGSKIIWMDHHYLKNHNLYLVIEPPNEQFNFPRIVTVLSQNEFFANIQREIRGQFSHIFNGIGSKNNYQSKKLSRRRQKMLHFREEKQPKKPYKRLKYSA